MRVLCLLVLAMPKAAKAKNRFPKDHALPFGVKTFDSTFEADIASAASWAGTRIATQQYLNPNNLFIAADVPYIPSGWQFGIQSDPNLLLRIHFRGSVIPYVLSDQADVPTFASIRLCVVLDTQANGAWATGEQVFTDMGSAAQCHFSFPAEAAGSGGRFKLLVDKLFESQPAATAKDAIGNTASVACGGFNFDLEYTWKMPLHCYARHQTGTANIFNVSKYNILFLAHATVRTHKIVGHCRAYYVET